MFRERIFTFVVAILLATAVAYTQPVGTGSPPIVHTDISVRNLNLPSIPPGNCLETAPGSSLVIGLGKPCGQPAGTGFNQVHQGNFISLSGTNADPIVNLATPLAPTALATSSVIAGSYTNPNITVDVHGLLTAASNGSVVGASVPAGVNPQIVGYTIGNVPQAFTMTADCALNSTYGITCTKINGITPGNVCPANQFVSQISGSAVGTCTQPSFSNISGTLVTSQFPTVGAAGSCTYCSLNIDATGRVTTYGSSSVFINTAGTTLNGTTAGSFVCGEPFQGTTGLAFKKIICILTGYENTTGTAQTYCVNVGGTGGCAVGQPFTTLVSAAFTANCRDPLTLSAAGTISLPINEATPQSCVATIEGN